MRLKLSRRMGFGAVLLGAILLVSAAAAPIPAIKRGGVVLVNPTDFGPAGVTFDQSGPDITLSTPRHTLKLQLGSLNATLDGAGLRLGAKPQYVGQAVWVPFEDVTTALDLTLAAEVRPEWGSAPKPNAGGLGAQLRGFQALSATGPLSTDQLRGGRDLVVPVQLPLDASAYVAACEAAVKGRLKTPALQFVRRATTQVYNDGDLSYQSRVQIQTGSGAVGMVTFTCMGSLDVAARLLYVKVTGDGLLK